jgi:hypothetical protein
LLFHTFWKIKKEKRLISNKEKVHSRRSCVDLSGEGIGIYERECLRGKERIFGILSGIGREEILIQKEGNQLLLVFSYGPYSL